MQHLSINTANVRNGGGLMPRSPSTGNLQQASEKISRGRSLFANNTSLHHDETSLPSFRGASADRSEEEIMEELGMDIQRATSAPPALEIQSNTIFSFQSKYSHLFNDIRCDEDYEKFYNSHSDPSKLPPPLEKDPLFINWDAHLQEVQKEKSTKDHFSMEAPLQAGSHPHVSMLFGPQLVQSVITTNGVHEHGDMHIPIPHWGPGSDGGGHMHMFAPPYGVQPPLAHQHIQAPQPRRAMMNGNMDASVERPIAQPVKPKTVKETTTTASAPLSFASVASAPPPQVQAVVTPRKSAQAASAVVSAETSPDLHAQPSPKDTGKEKSEKSSTDRPRRGSAKKDGDLKYNHISEVTGRIYPLAKDQFGCRFLQKKLEDGDPRDIEAIYSEVYDHIAELMTDPFGNYLCQKLVEHCNDKQKTNIISAVSSSLVRISTNMHGTRAVQKLIETIHTPQQVGKVIDALRNSVVVLIKDLNGNHVIQRCLQKLSYQDKQFIYDAVAAKCVEVSTHKHGCCVLQRCIDYASEDQKMQLVRQVTEHALVLVQNAFGNYVVQYVLDLGHEESNGNIITRFLGSLCSLSQNKFSSNVIEKCLRIAPQRVRHAMIEELLHVETLAAIIQDSFGNYVVQTALTVCDPKQFQTFNELLRPMLALVRNTPYGKKIESKLNKRPSTYSDGNGTAHATPSVPSTTVKAKPSPKK